MSKNKSAGILVYRINNKTSEPEFLLCYPGGKYYNNDNGTKKNDLNRWGIPKGKVDDNETIFNAAIREFTEETDYIIKSMIGYEDFIELKPCRYKSGKKVYAFAIELDLDILLMKSNLFNGVPEIVDYKYFNYELCKLKCHLSQLELIEQLREIKKWK